jgi:hypothetical protein
MILGALVVLGCGRKGAESRTEDKKSYIIPRTTVDEVGIWMEEGRQITFVDARSDGAWEKRLLIVPGAFRISPTSPDEFPDNLPRRGTFVAYCT